MGVEVECCETGFWIHIMVIMFLVVFAGMMSGLTLGLMSLSLVDLEVLAKSGTPQDQRYAEKILPVVKNQHLLLCTLLICNAAAMEALPIFLDALVTSWGAILISVTLILLFGEIIPQSVCTRYGLAIGATAAPLVRILVWICSPVAYPISKLLDYLLGHGQLTLFRRAELKMLVNLHGNEAGKGGELTHDETTIIAGALELSEKTAGDAMTPIYETFAIDINAKLDRDLMNIIQEKGHSRIPVYYEQHQNIIGLILAKNLLTIHPEDEVPVKSVSIRRIPRVPDSMPLYDILNEFQKGHSHMAVVIRQSNKVVEQNGAKSPYENADKDVRLDMDGEKHPPEKSLKTKRSLHKWKSFPNSGNNSFKSPSRGKKWTKEMYSHILQIDGKPLPKVPEEEEAVGIITMEDVIEELLQEEIFDETDHHYEDS
ncbi:ion channel [Lithospermum erythrorhizon]|uniref:Ion channel n=1 Tax=Lithospermum erythrorhizon TaxID=34254 RepID=A0AAV3RL53_LITER